MEKYIANNLLENEEIVYEGHRHWMVFSLSVLWLIAATYFFIYFEGLSHLAIIPYAIALATGIGALINFTMTEIGVTNMRVIIKVGLFSRASVETYLTNIATITIEQGYLGKLFNFGTVNICDTGQICNSFTFIKQPLVFRKAVQESIEELHTILTGEEVETFSERPSSVEPAKTTTPVIQK